MPTAWTVAPDWNNGVTETLAWLTDTMMSQSGAEQRRSLRVSPRRQIEMDFTVDGPTRTFLDLALANAAADDWLLPLFFDGQPLTAIYNAGSQAVYCDTNYTEFIAGTKCILWRNATYFEVHTIQSVSTTTITFAEVTSMQFGPTDSIYPVREAMLTDAPTMSRLSSRVAQGTLRFQLKLNNNFQPGFETMGSYNGFNVMQDGGNERDNIDLGWNRQTLDLDGDTGQVWRTDTQGFANPTIKLQRMLVGRAAHWSMRQLLYALCGQRVPIYVPTFAEDLDLAASTTGGSLVVDRVGLSTFGIMQNRRDIDICLLDGTHFYTTITGANAVDAWTERLTIAFANFGRTIQPSMVKRISFMSVCRLTADSIDIKHYADQHGASELTLPFQSAPEIRNVV